MSSKKSSNIRYWLTLITHLADTEQLLKNLNFNNPKLSKSILNSLPYLYLHQKCVDLLQKVTADLWLLPDFNLFTVSLE